MCLILVQSTKTVCSKIVPTFHPTFHSKWVICVVVVQIGRHQGAGGPHNSQPQVSAALCCVGLGWTHIARPLGIAVGQGRSPVFRKPPASTGYSAFTWKQPDKLWHISCLAVEMPDRFFFSQKTSCKTSKDTNLVTFPWMESALLGVLLSAA